MKTPMPPHQRTIAEPASWNKLEAEIVSDMEKLEAMLG